CPESADPGGVVEEKSEPAPLSPRAEEPLAHRRVRYVAGDGCHAPALAPSRPGDLLQPLRPPGVQDQVISPSGQERRQQLAEPAARAGDDRHTRRFSHRFTSLASSIDLQVHLKSSGKAARLGAWTPS